jgi:alcohol dehydrogenase
VGRRHGLWRHRAVGGAGRRGGRGAGGRGRRSRAALDAATALGAAIAIDSSSLCSARAVADAVLAATDGGAHLSIDALGSPETAIASILGLRKRGRHVQVGLLLGEESTPPIPMDRVIARELEILGSHGMAAHEYPEMLARIADGRLQPDRLVGRTISLDEVPAAIVAMGAPATGAGMTVIVPGRGPTG